MMRKKIVVIGSSNVDMIMKMDRLPREGETVTGATFFQVFGGKGANQAVAAARAGGEVIFLTAVGNDPYSKQMLENFRNDGIDTHHILKERDEVSGHALIMIGNAGQNYISVAPGANACLTPEKIKKVEAVIGDAAIIVMQYEIPKETIAYVLDYAEDKGIPVLWNFAPAQDFDLKYLKKSDILVVNESEAGFLTNMEVGDQQSAEKAIQKLLKRGPALIILTLGADGVLCASKGKIKHLSAFKVHAEDTTAAGDVFCGTFSVAHVEGNTLTNSIRFASAAAALCVTKIGAQPSIPHRLEIDAFLAGQ